MSVFSLRGIVGLLVLAILVSTPVAAQTLPPPARTVELSGPRFGLTFLDEGVVRKLHERNIDVTSTVSQFGWHFEKQLFHRSSGVTAVTEWVALLGGLEQNTAIPSLSWLVGFRTRDGAEFGIGPNITPGGTALVLAAGHTFRSGVMNVPVNLAVVPSKHGVRVTLLTGFSLR